MTGTEQKQPVVNLPKAMDHQRSVILSPARFKVVVCGRRWGKTALGLMATLKGHGQTRGQRRGAIDGGTIWWIAPSYKVASKIWRDLKRATRDAWTNKNEVERRIELPGGGSVTVHSADDPGTLVGDGLDGVVIDEAAKVHRDAWGESIRPALADRLGWAVFIGTPKGPNWFREIFDLAGADSATDWDRWQRPTWDNPIILQSEVDDMRREMTGTKFAQEIEAVFVSDTGILFPRAKVEIVEAAPVGIERLVRYWDKAGSDADGDFTAGILIGRKAGLFYVLDVIHGRWQPFDRNEIMRSTCIADEAKYGRHGVSLWIEREPGNGGKESAMISVRDLAQWGPQTETPSVNKVARAEHFAAQWQAGNVRILRAAWNAKYIDELASFPDEDLHDDQVDASTGAFNKLVLHRPQPRADLPGVYVPGGRR